MPGVYKLSKESAIDVAAIYEYGIEKFGLLQAQNYLSGMQDLFQTLADNPHVGRNASELVSSLKRFPYKSHVVFYLPADTGILIIRTLHHSMDYQKYL